jgi:hypothetical protein
MMKTLLQALQDIYLMAPSAGGSRGHCRQAVNVQGEKDRVHRVATAAFWRTFKHEGKISRCW